MVQNRTNNRSTYPNRPLSSACHAATENANESIRSGNRGEGGNCRRPEVQGGPGHAGVARNQRQRAHVSTAPIPPRTRPPWPCPCPCASDPQRIRRGRPPAPPARTPPPNRAPPRRKSRPGSPSARQVSRNSFSIPSIRPSCCLPVHFLLLVKRAPRFHFHPRTASSETAAAQIHTHADTDRQNRRWGFQIPERISPQVEGKLLPPRRDLQFVLLQRR